MKVTFDAEVFKKIILRASNFTRPFGFMPEYNYFHFSGDAIRAFGGDVGLIHLSPETFEEDVVVSATLFSEFLPGLSGKIEISTGKDVVVKSGSFTARLQKVAYNKKYFEFEMPNIESFTKFPVDFLDNLKKIYFSVCKDQTKYDMRGVQWKDYFYSTDGYRMSRFKPSFKTDESFVIPDLLLSLLIPEKDGPIGYCFAEDKLWFVYEDYFAFGVCSTSPFRNCEAVFTKFLEQEKSKSIKVEFDSSKLIDSITKLLPFSQVHPKRMEILVSPDNLVLYSVTQNNEAEAIEVFPCKVTGEIDFSTSYPVNINFFKEVVEKSEVFYVTPNYIYFQSNSGLESLLLGLQVDKPYAEDVLGRLRSHIPVREVEVAGKGPEKEEAVKGVSKERKRTPKYAWEDTFDDVPF